MYLFLIKIYVTYIDETFSEHNIFEMYKNSRTIIDFTYSI